MTEQLDGTLHYAQQKLSEAQRSISLAAHEMPILRGKIDSYIKKDKSRAQDVYQELVKRRTLLLEAISLSRLCFMEMELKEHADYAGKLHSAVSGFNLMTPDYSKLHEALERFLSKLSAQGLCSTEGRTTNAAVIGRLMNHIKIGYYPTDLEHIKMLVKGIDFPEGVTTNLFDPCCGCGLALRSLADGNNCYTFGVEIDRNRAEEAQSRLHRVGFGSYFYSRISHEAFHLMLLNPPYLSVINKDGGNTRHEKRFLVDSYEHLMPGGLLIYIIPYYRLTPDICRVLCDNFDDITVWKFGGKEFERFRQIAVMGTRIKKRNGSELALELAKIAYSPEEIPELSNLPEGRYALPANARKVDIYKGAEFNVAELAEQLKKSKSFVKLIEKNRLDSMQKRPLLPLNIGQVGLIGGSGLINGLIECETPHIIKGRVVKSVRRERENTVSKGKVVASEETETTSNKMIFNVLTPSGFKSLA